MMSQSAINESSDQSAPVNEVRYSTISGSSDQADPVDEVRYSTISGSSDQAASTGDVQVPTPATAKAGQSSDDASVRSSPYAKFGMRELPKLPTSSAHRSIWKSGIFLRLVGFLVLLLSVGLFLAYDQQGICCLLIHLLLLLVASISIASLKRLFLLPDALRYHLQVYETDICKSDWIADTKCCKFVVDAKCNDDLQFAHFAACRAFLAPAHFARHCLNPPISSHYVDRLLIGAYSMLNGNSSSMLVFDYTLVTGALGASHHSEGTQFLMYLAILASSIGITLFLALSIAEVLLRKVYSALCNAILASVRSGGTQNEVPQFRSAFYRVSDESVQFGFQE